jgi:serine O-acetyltransferase
LARATACRDEHTGSKELTTPIDDEPEAADGPPRASSPRWAAGLRGDFDRMLSDQETTTGRRSVASAVERAFTRPGPLAIVVYRAAHGLWGSGHHVMAELLWRLNLALTGADIHPAAEIGGGLRMTHTSGVVISREARIGSNVTIAPQVVVGGSARGWFDSAIPDGSPDIGDDTQIWAGAKVLGPIKVGRACHIGANAVLARDLPDGASYTSGQSLRALAERVEKLEARLAQREETAGG